MSVLNLNNPVLNLNYLNNEIRNNVLRISVSKGINSTFGSSGRLCNQIIRNIVCSQLSEKYNLKFQYEYYDEITKLGIRLYTEGCYFHNNTLHLTDNDFHRFMYDEELKSNIFTNRTFFQNEYFAKYFWKYFKTDEIKSSIMDHNLFKERYKNNNDVYVHLRLGDVIEYAPSFEYYDKILSSLRFDNGYISTETLDHPLFIALIDKYKLIPILKDVVETIMFGSTCKYIVLTGGTMSWTIGLFGYFSTIYYPDLELRPLYHPIELYDYPDWNKITYEEYKFKDVRGLSFV